MSFGTTELLVIFAILVLIFGSRRLRNLGSDLGNAIRGFRSSLNADPANDKSQELDSDANQELSQEQEDSGKPTGN